MLILGIETATERVSVAVGGHEGVIGLFEVTKGRRHAETLVPAIEFVCRQAGIELDEISVVAVDVGPGLFTGHARRAGVGQGDRAGVACPDDRHLVARPARVPLPAHRPCRRAGHRCPQGRSVLRDVPAGAGRRAAGRRADGRARRGSGCRSDGEEPGRRCSSVMVHSAIATRSSRASIARSAATPTRPPVRWCSSRTPVRCARSGSTRGRSNRSTCGLPMRRSTGRLGRPGRECDRTSPRARCPRGRPDRGGWRRDLPDAQAGRTRRGDGHRGPVAIHVRGRNSVFAERDSDQVRGGEPGLSSLLAATAGSSGMPGCGSPPTRRTSPTSRWSRPCAVVESAAASYLHSPTR